MSSELIESSDLDALIEMGKFAIGEKRHAIKVDSHFYTSDELAELDGMVAQWEAVVNRLRSPGGEQATAKQTA